MEPLSTATPRAYSAAHFAMTLDGFRDGEIGLFRSIEGGGVKVEAMTYQTGGTAAIQRFPGKPKFEDFKVTCGAAMSVAFYDWLQRFFRGIVTPHNGELIAADFHYNVRARRKFTNAIISEATFPKLDAGDKGPANITVSISPEVMEFLKPEGQQKLNVPELPLAQKLWTACNFDFFLDGYETVSKNVSKVDAITIKQKIIDYHVGGQRHPQKHAGRFELPNINFYVPEAFAFDLLKASQERGFKGPEKPIPALKGHITTYSNDRTPLFEIGFGGGEIVNMTIDKSDAGSEEIKQVKFEMAIQTISFTHIDYQARSEKLLAQFDE